MPQTVSHRRVGYVKRITGLVVLFLSLVHSGPVFAQKVTFVVDNVRTDAAIDMSELKAELLGEQQTIEFFASGKVLRDEENTVCNLSGMQGAVLGQNLVRFDCPKRGVDSQHYEFKRVGRYILSGKAIGIIRLEGREVQLSIDLKRR